MRALTPRSRLHGQQGASMALILALIAILGLCVGAIATQGTAGMLAVQGVTNQRSDVYGAEGAVDSAINYIRNDLTRGRLDTTKCPASNHNLSNPIFQGTGDTGTVTVTCQSLAGSGSEIEGINYPENAILTTGGLAGYPVIDNACSGDPGICVTGNSSGVIKVQGSVKSNATSKDAASITVTNGKLDAGSDAIRARGVCSPTPPTPRIVGQPVACRSDVIRPDPGGLLTEDKPTTHTWGSEIQTLPPQAPNPTCNTTTRIATMTPGSYFDRDDLIGGFSTGSTYCTLVWMQPGNYYFDFEFNKNNGVEDSDQAGGLWRIGHDDLGRAQGMNAPGRVVVGGTRTCNPSPGFCWDNSKTATQVLDAFPTSGACNRSAANGVHTVLAGDTTYDVKDYGKLELCPFPNSSRQQIAVYGRKTTQTYPGSAIFKPASATASPSAWAIPFANLASIDTLSNSVTQTGPNRTNLLTLHGYAPTVPLPPLQSLGSVTMRISHRETTSSSLSTTITAKIIRGDNSSPTACTLSVPKRTTLTTDSINVPTDCISAMSQLSGAKVEWRVVGGSQGTTQSLTTELNGIEFTADYTGRGLRAKDPGSLIVWMWGPWNNKQPQIYIWGTVYAPTSRIHLETAGVLTTRFQFGRGVVVAGLQVDDLDVEQPLVAFANASGVAHYNNRRIELIAWIGGSRQLRVVVEFEDVDDPSTPGREVRIISWNAVN